MLKNVAIEIKNERIRNKKTMKDLSNASGISIKQICMIEKGRVTPTLETLKKIANPLGIEICIKITFANHSNAIIK